MEKIYTILIVDDIKENIDVLAGLLKDSYNLKFALSGKMALSIAEKFKLDLILLDIMMPEIDGYQTCKKLKNNIRTKEIPVIFVTAKVEIEDEKKGFDVGAIDYITKPIKPLIVKTRIRMHLENSNQKKELEILVDEKIKDLNEINYEIINILGRASEHKDNETAEHLKRTSEYSYLLAINAGLSEKQAKLIKMAAPMHDIGKIGIPDGILQKNGPLNDEEWKFIKNHPEIGKKILGKQNSELLNIASCIAYEHHEKWDGSGYPNGLKGIDISLEARIISVVDVFDALTSKRPYKDEWPLEKAFNLIEEEAGKHFDPELAKIFLENKDKMKHIRDIIKKGDNNDN